MTRDVKFRLLMERADNAMQNCGLILQGNGAAMADWRTFSQRLSDNFLVSMRDFPATEELINRPPRRRMNIDGIAQWGPPVAPITTNENLITRGVCQVRHNIVHGNKLDLDERDMKLIDGATYVLRAAIAETLLFQL